MRRWLLVILLLPCTAAGQQPPADDPGVRVRFPPPSLRIGDDFRVDLRVRLHADVREYWPELPIQGDTFLFRRARVGVQGRVFGDVEYEVDAELRDDEHPWRNVYVNYRRFRAAEIRAGRFKIPFSREQLTGVFTINFAERSLIASQLAPARDRGVMVHGRLAGDVVSYETGVFRHDGDNSRFAGPGADATWAGRLVIAPLARLPRRCAASNSRRRDRGDVPEGLNGLRGRTLSGYTFAEPVYVKGRRIRLGVEGGWEPGPFSIEAEYVRVRDERNGQGLGDVDLPEAIAQGWYVSGTWAVTGERKAGGIEPRRAFPLAGPGAIELAARIEEMQFGSAGTGGEPPFRNPRSANLLPNRDRIVTLGVNWYLNRFGRVTVNATRESVQDPARSPLLDRTTFWGAVCRLQFVM